MKRETENKQQSFSFKKGHTLPMSDENLDFLENCQKALLIGNLRGMIVDNNDDGKPSFFQTSGIGNEKAKMALTFYKRFSDVNKFTHFLVHEDDLQYYKDFIENFALENCQIITHRLRGKSTEYKIAFVPPAVSSDIKSSFNIRNEYLQDMETLAKFEVGSDEQDNQIKYMLQKYVAICLNYTDGKLNEVYTDHGNITVIVYKDNKMFTNVYYKVNKLTGEKIEIRDFDNVPKMFNDRINRFKGKKTMTYDFILMNPPYDKNLHLKIIEQSIPMLTDDGILVNLSPIRWLQDPLAKYKKTSDYYKSEESVAKHIEDVHVVRALTAQEMFSSGQYEDLGIYVIRKAVRADVHPIIETLLEPKMKGLFYKVNLPTYQKKFVSIYDVRTPEGMPDYSRPFVKVSHLHGNIGSRDYADIISPNKEITMKQVEAKTGGGSTPTINFDTDVEANNFADSLQMTFMKACNYNCKTNMRWPGYAIPFMGDCINPRTGLKGYESDWTDDDFRAYFGITDSEWEEIVETMKPYL